jgi:hypothetical protein
MIFPWLSFLGFLIVGMKIIGDITLRTNVLWVVGICLVGAVVTMIVLTVLKFVVRRKGYAIYLAVHASPTTDRKNTIQFLNSVY